MRAALRHYQMVTERARRGEIIVWRDASGAPVIEEIGGCMGDERTDMDLKEARKVAKIVETAEGGCGGCINEAARELNKKFPGFDWVVVNIEGFHASIDVRVRYDADGAPLNEPHPCLNMRPGYRRAP